MRVTVSLKNLMIQILHNHSKKWVSPWIPVANTIVHFLLWKHAKQIWQTVLISKEFSQDMLFDDESVTSWN